MAEEEEEDDAEQDGRQVHLGRLLLVVLLGALVSHPARKDSKVVDFRTRTDGTYVQCEGYSLE